MQFRIPVELDPANLLAAPASWYVLLTKARVVNMFHLIDILAKSRLLHQEWEFGVLS